MKLLLLCNSKIDENVKVSRRVPRFSREATTWIPKIFERGVCADLSAAGHACARSTEFPERISRINPRDDVQWRGAPRCRRTLFFLLLPFFVRSIDIFVLPFSPSIYYFSPYQKSLVFRIEWNVSSKLFTVTYKIRANPKATCLYGV